LTHYLTHDGDMNTNTTEAREQAAELHARGILTDDVYAATIANIEGVEARQAQRLADEEARELARKAEIEANVAAGRFKITRGRIS
jgi:hypothetical protein